MTAIKTLTTANGDNSSNSNSNTAHASARGPTGRRAQGSSSSPSSSTGSGRSLSAAKAKFLDSVGDGVNVLMRRCGYSRERATNTLLRELCRGESSLADNEVSWITRDNNKALTMESARLDAVHLAPCPWIVSEWNEHNGNVMTVSFHHA